MANQSKRKNTEQIREEIHQLTNGEYELIGEYKNNKTKIEVLHKTCGRSWFVQIVNFRHGRRCPVCSRKRVSEKQKKTHEQFLSEISEIKDDLIFIEEYKGANQPLRVIHKACNQEIIIRPSHLISKGIQCRHCFLNKRRYSIEEVKDKIRKMTNGEYEVLSNQYINNRTELKFIHHKCGFEYTCTLDGFVSKNTRCPLCDTKSPLTKDVMLHRINALSRTDFELIEIVNTRRIVVKHKVCGKESNVDYQNFMQGSGCPKCNNYKKSHNEFVKDVYNLVGDSYTVLGQYKSTKDKIEMRHEECGNIFKVRPIHFLKYYVRCNECYYNGQSKKEEEIDKYLKSLNIKFKRQYTFDDCKNIRLLPFDFAIFDNNNNLSFLIEYHGEQHYKPVERFGGEEKFIKTRNNDIIKEKYCRDNDIKLVIIPYTDFKNFREIISRELGVNQDG